MVLTGCAAAIAHRNHFFRDGIFYFPEIYVDAIGKLESIGKIMLYIISQG